MGYEVGQSVALACVFSEKDGYTDQLTQADTGLTIQFKGAAVDPAEVILKVTDGAGALHTSDYADTAGSAYPIVRDPAGGYYAYVLLDRTGVWRYRWEGDPGTDEAKVSDTHEFAVRAAGPAVVAPLVV